MQIYPYAHTYAVIMIVLLIITTMMILTFKNIYYCHLVSRQIQNTFNKVHECMFQETKFEVAFQTFKINCEITSLKHRG